MRVIASPTCGVQYKGLIGLPLSYNEVYSVCHMWGDIVRTIIGFSLSYYYESYSVPTCGEDTITSIIGPNFYYYNTGYSVPHM